MKTKIIFLCLLMSFWCVPIFGQDSKEVPKKLSLKKAQQIAFENNPSLEVQQLKSKIDSKKVEAAKWERIPNIYADYGLKRNLIIPTTPVPAKAFNPNAKEGELMPLKFATNWSSNAGINLEYDLFNPQKNGQVKATQQQMKLSSIDQEIEKNNLKFKVGKDYAACIIAKEQLELAVADTISKTKLLKMTREQYDAGRKKITDLNQAQANKNEAISNCAEARKILSSSKLDLLVDMGFDPSKENTFSLTDSISNLLLIYEDENGGNQESLSLEKRRQQKELTEIQLQNAKKGFLPTVSLNGYLGTNYYDNDFRYFDNKNWYGNSFVGLKVLIPLTQGLNRVKKIDELQLQRKLDEVNYRVQQNQILLEITKAKQEADFQENNMNQKKKSMQLASENWKAAVDQFSEGRLLSGDLIKVDYAYKQAKTEYLKAAYNFLIAKMTLEELKRK